LPKNGNIFIPDQQTNEDSWTERIYQTNLVSESIQYIDVLIYEKSQLSQVIPVLLGKYFTPLQESFSPKTCDINLGCIKFGESHHFRSIPNFVKNISASISWNQKSVDLGHFIVDIFLTWEEQENNSTKYCCIYDGANNFIGRSS